VSEQEIENGGEKLVEASVLGLLARLVENSLDLKTKCFASGGGTEMGSESMPWECCETVQQRRCCVEGNEPSEKGEAWAIPEGKSSAGQQMWREGKGSGIGQVKLLPAPQLPPASSCQNTLVLVG